jgi:hypothetical protein
MTCYIGENSAFVSDMVNLLETDGFWLPEYLESINFGVELVIEGDVRGRGGANEADSSKGSFR